MADAVNGEIKDIAGMKRHLASDDPACVYLLFGEENYLKELYFGRLRKKLADGDMNVIRMSGEFDPDFIKDGISGISLFGEKKLIAVRNSGIFKKSADLDFLDGIEGSGTSVVFIEDEADRRSSSFKSILKRGIVFECVKAEPKDIKALLSAEAKRASRILTPDAADLMIEGIGRDMSTLLGELEKLILFVPQGGRIEERHVRAVCTLSLSARIFDLTGAISEGETGKALKLLHAIVDDREKSGSPLGILTMIARNWESIYRAKIMLKDGFTEQDIARMTGQKPYPVKKQCEQSRRFTQEELRKKMDLAAGLDRAIKTGLLDDITALEIAVTC